MLTMTTEPIIEFEQVSKYFQLQLDSVRTVQELFSFPFKTKKPVKKFRVLEDVNLKIYAGDCVGVIGNNGVGKSTLLKLMSNILKPNHGTVTVRGCVVPLLELGAGFHNELTGHENIFLYGSILGMSRKQILYRYEDIVTFSGMREYLKIRMKYYSSGMLARLAFAIAIYSEFDILLADEVFSVGDVPFQHACLERLREFQRQQKTLLLVSHQHELIHRLCSKIIEISDGTIEMRHNPLIMSPMSDVKGADIHP